MTIARSADCTETITVMTKMVTSCVTAVPVRLIHMREVKKMTDNLVNKSGDLVNDLVNDTISRAAALDALDKRFDSIPMEQTTEILLLRKDLRKLPSAQPGWIPVTERLPKKDGDYLVTTHSGQIARYIFIGGSSEEYWRRCATAWMPLPKPWEGGQNNG